MGFLRILHVPADNTNGMGNVWSGFSEVEQFFNKHPIDGCVDRGVFESFDNVRPSGSRV